MEILKPGKDLGDVIGVAQIFFLIKKVATALGLRIHINNINFHKLKVLTE